MLLQTSKQIDFSCQGLLSRHQKQYKGFPIEMYCSEDNETFSILEIDHLKKNKADTERRKMMISKIYKEHSVANSQKNDEHNNHIKMYCYDLTTLFIIFNSGFFNCIPQPYPDQDGNLDVEYIYSQFNEELYDIVEHYVNQLRYHFKITFLDLKLMFSNFDDIEGKKIMAIKKAFPVQVNSKIEYFNLKKSQKDQSQPVNTLSLDGQEGMHFQFRLNKLPLYFFKCTIYYASDKFIRIIVKSNSKEFNSYFRRDGVLEHDAETGYFHSKDVKKGKTEQSLNKQVDREDLIRILYKDQIGKFIQQFYGDDIYLFNSKIQYQNENPTIESNKPARGILSDYQKENLLNTPIIVLMIFDLFVNSDEQDEKLNPLATTHINYYFLVPIKNEDNIALDTIDTEKWFYVAHDQLGNDRVNNLGALYQYMSLQSMQSQRIQENEDLQLTKKEQIIEINTYIEEYFNSRYNYFQFTIGLKEIMRKMVIRLYGFEDIFYPNIQMKIFTQYFVTEHIIPLTEYDSFRDEINKKIREAVDHYQDYVIELDRVDLNSQTISVDDFKFFIGEFLKDKHFCIQEGNENEIFSIKYNYDTDFKENYEDNINCKTPNEDKYQPPDHSNHLPNCSSNIMQKTAFVLKEKQIDEENSVYILTINEPKTASKKNPSQTSFQTYKEYQYNYKPMLRRQIKSHICHLLTDDYSRPNIDKALRHEIFTGRRPQEL